MLTDWTGSITPLTLSGEGLDFVDSFTYLGSCIIAGGKITDEITFGISRARAVFGNLRHLLRRTDISFWLNAMCITAPFIQHSHMAAKNGQYVQKTFIDCRFRPQMSRDHRTYLLGAEGNQRGGASKDFQIDWQSKKLGWYHPTGSSSMARSCPPNGRLALNAEGDVRHPRIQLEEISWRSATDMAIEYEENYGRLSGCWSLPLTGLGPSWLSSPMAENFIRHGSK